MKNFAFFNPTRVFFGAGEMNRLGKEAVKYGKKAMLVKTEGPLEKMGVYDRATKLMENEGMTVVPLNGVTSNPKLSKIEEGISICKAEGVDIVIAVGGGSGIDSAKAIAYGALDDGDLWDFFTLKRVAAKSLPIGAVSTIAATGSEMNVNCVVTNDRDPDMNNWRKWSTHFEHSFPQFAILDPQLHVSVPKYLTAAGMADTISHVLEGYFDGEEDTPLQDRLGEGVIQTVIENDGVLSDPGNVSYRANLSWAATLALNGLHDAGRGGKAYDAHTIEHELGAKTDCTHGAGLAVCHTAWLYHLNSLNPKKFVQFAERVFGIRKADGMTDEEVGKMGIDALKAKFKSWGMPLTLKELGVKREDIPKLALDMTQNPEGVLLKQEVLIEVLEGCYE